MRWIALGVFFLMIITLLKINQLETALQDIVRLQSLIDEQQKALNDLKVSCQAPIKNSLWMREQVRNIPMD